jgi:hypothetical protein
LKQSANFYHMLDTSGADITIVRGSELDTSGADITTVRGSELENWVKGHEALLGHW